ENGERATQNVLSEMSIAVSPRPCDPANQVRPPTAPRTAWGAPLPAAQPGRDRGAGLRVRNQPFRAIGSGTAAMAGDPPVGDGSTVGPRALEHQRMRRVQKAPP